MPHYQPKFLFASEFLLSFHLATVFWVIMCAFKLLGSMKFPLKFLLICFEPSNVDSGKHLMLSKTLSEMCYLTLKVLTLYLKKRAS